MSNGKFPEVILSGAKSGLMNRDERYWYELPSMMQYLKKKCKGWSIADFVTELGAKNVIVYAISDFTQIIIDDVAGSDSEVEVSCICDRRFHVYPKGYNGLQVIGPVALQEMYCNQQCDKILISSVMHENSIVKDLLGMGIKPEDIISVRDAVFYE